jgi:hypothetical protein
MSALKQPTIRVVAIIAEGVPESDAKQLISYARANNKVKTKLNKLFFHTIWFIYKLSRQYSFISINDYILLDKFIKKNCCYILSLIFGKQF